jgi:hypothetical protein
MLAMAETESVPKESNPQASAGRDRRRQPRKESRTELRLFLLGVAVFSFVAGTLVVEFRLFPYPQALSPAFQAARAWRYRIAATSCLRETDLWYPTDFRERGVVRHDPAKAFEGYTFYTSSHAQGAILIDMEGRVVHRWQAPFRTAWPGQTHVSSPVPKDFIHWRRAHLCGNGDVLAVYEGFGGTPWGYGLVKLDRDSNVLWKCSDSIHHDVYVHTDGTIFTLAHELRNTHQHPVEGASQLRDVVLDDFVVHLSAEGDVLQRVSVLDALAASGFRDLLAPVSRLEWDVLHMNTVKVITPQFAAHHDFARPGQLLLSSRSRDALAILDLEARRIVWASCGPYRRQHDADLLDNGHVLLFDNQGHAGPGGLSRVIELDPETQAITWSYAGDASHELSSMIMASQQLLPNGNVLITESCGGRILEVTREGEIVWEFRNPARLDGDPTTVAIICGAERFSPDQLQFRFNRGERSPHTATNPNTRDNR